MNVETLEDLFGYQLQRAYYVERTQVELLAEMAASASSDDLADRFADHREQTEGHVVRLERVFEALGRRPHASRTRTIDGVTESWRQHDESTDGPAVPSALEIALTTERLEIRAYESLLTLAGRLAYADDVVEPLETILEEERAALGALEDLESELSVLETVAVDDA
ncbi:ferritin-like domain-containing protein [Natronorubrum sp. FCH18a]|uniref:YciE/YciF ferroxidase family protein n=1 Tax=Natronorubrum sp. FCH18a TaxID=3447018 RepID=UPI003F516099